MFQWILLILVALAIGGGYTYTYMQKYKAEGSKAVQRDLQATVYALMVMAQKKWGQGPGKEKFSWVVKTLYQYVAPDVLDKFAPDVEQFVQTQYEQVYKRLLDYFGSAEPIVNGPVVVENITDEEKDSLLTDSELLNTEDEK